MSGFNNPIIGGGGALVYPSIHSPNFIHLLAGWSINKDGTAEFQNIIARGDISATTLTTANLTIDANGNVNIMNSFGAVIIRLDAQQDAIYIYEDTGSAVQGNLVAAFAPTSGNDPIKNQSYNAVIESRDQATGHRIFMNAGQLSFKSQGLTTVDGFLQGFGGTAAWGSAQIGAADTFAQIILQSKNESNDGVHPEAVFTQRVQLQDENGNPGIAVPVDPANPNQDESWHSLGALGAHYTVTIGKYRLTNENDLELDIKVVGDGLQATSVSFATTLAAGYRPSTNHDTIPMGTTRQVTVGDIWPRLAVSSAGVVTVTNQGSANTFAFCGVVPRN